MAIKYILKLKSTASPHLFLDDIKKMIANDKVLYPQTKKMLLLLKKFNRSYLQLALERELIIYPKSNFNLERALSPQLTVFQKFDWNEEDIEKYKSSKEIFIRDVLKFYDKLGYEISQVHIDDSVVEQISKDIDIHQKELQEKIKKEQEKGAVKNG